MQIKFFAGFYKKENSTKQPNLSNPTVTIDGYLREPSSMLNPVFKIKRLSSDASPTSYTYAYILEFERYYFVRDWVWADGVWECHLAVDVLASWKADLATQQEYILRTDTTNNPTDFNEYISDITYPVTTNYKIETFSTPASFVTNITDGIYIVGIISGDNTNAVGAVSYYALTYTQFGDLKHVLFTDDNLEVMDIIDSQGTQLVQDMSKQILKTLYNPYQYIVSCYYFPITANAILYATPVTTIPIGWWDYSLNGLLLTAQTCSVSDTMISINQHPQSTTRGKFLNYAPYTRITLIGRYGTIAIDPAFIKRHRGEYTTTDLLYVRYDMDLISGQCIANVIVNSYDPISGTSTNNTIMQRQFLIGVPIQLAQVGVDYLGSATSAVSSALSAGANLASHNVAGAIASEVNGIYNVISSAMPQLETGGMNGSFLEVSNNTKGVVIYYQIADEDIAHRGRAVCGIRTLNTLSGFVLCAEGDVDLKCFDEERTAIKRFLTTGFFWE